MRDSSVSASEKAAFSVYARLKSFVYAGRGLRQLVIDEHNTWLHLLASCLVIISGFALRISLADWRWLVVAISAVWLAEAFNTAIEELCDRISPEFDEAIGRVKDLSAGAVLIASLAAAAIGGLTLAPYLIVFIR